MNWKKVLFNFVAAPLLVTIIGGMVVFYLTKPPKNVGEKLVYEIDEPVAFDADKVKVSLFWLRVKNNGDAPSKQVEISVKFPDGIKVRAHKVVSSNAPLAKINQVSSEGHNLVFATDNLLPDESISISLMIDSAFAAKPDVIVRSSNTIGELYKSSPAKNNSVLSVLNRTIIVTTIPLLTGLSSLLVLLIFRLRKFNLSLFSSKNNAGFVLLHKGNYQLAQEIFKSAIITEGAEPILLSNFALSSALSGEVNVALSTIESAEWWASLGRQKAIVYFNKALIYGQNGDEALCLEALKKAFELSPSDIKSYCEMSTIVIELSSKYSSVKKEIEGNQKAWFSF